MMDIGNNRVCTCGEKETSEHKIRCRERKVKEEDIINEEWLRETDNMKKVRMVNEYMKKKIEERKLEEEKEKKEKEI